MSYISAGDKPFFIINSVKISPLHCVSVLNEGEKTLREILSILEVLAPYRNSNFQILNIMLKIKKQEYGLCGLILEKLLEEFSANVGHMYTIINN